MRMVAAAEPLFDLQRHLMAQEVDQGWGAFHAGPLWFQRNLPPPHLNDAGRAFAIEMLRQALGGGAYLSEWLLHPRPVPDYRSHLMPGALEISSAPIAQGMPRDEVANAVTLELARRGGRHATVEIARDRELAWRAKLNGGRLTPEPMFSDCSDEMPVPVRAAGVPIERDSEYWRAVYALPRVRVAEFSGVEDPHWIVELMRVLGPDFPLDPVRSNAQLLCFVQAGDREVAWAVQFRRTSIYFDSRIWLVCAPRRAKRFTRTNTVEIPFELLVSERVLDTSARGIECALMYWLPRFRAFVSALDPLAVSAMREA